MSEYLVLRLHTDEPDRASWVIADSSGQRASLTESGTLAEAAQRAQQRPVMVLVPGQDVLLTRISLPVRGAAKMLQAAPFALEEQLADNLRHMHFALGPRDTAGKVQVAVVREQLMQGWLAQLDATGLETTHILPDTVGIPPHDGVTILIDGPACLIRDPEGRVLVGDTESAPAFIAAMGLDSQTENEAHLYVSQDDTNRYSQVVSEIRMGLPEIVIIDLRHGALPVIASTAITTPQPNLLQGEYARSSGSEKLWGPWRTAAMLAGAFILVALGGKALEVMRLKAELQTLNAELHEIAAEVLEGGRIVDPLLQMEQLAASLSGSATGNNADFLEMLDSLSSALTTTGNTTLEKLDYRNGTMDLALNAPSVDALDKISRDMAETGLKAEIQSAKQDDEVVKGRLRVSELTK